MSTCTRPRIIVGACAISLLAVAGAAPGMPSGGASSDCYEVHGLPGCDDAVCVAAVCPHDPHCCAVTWDAICVAYANVNCALRLGDLTGDDHVNGADLSRLLSRWGSAAGDVTGDFVTDARDLGVMLTNWTG